MSQQHYHSNAKTNIHVRQQIRVSSSSNDELCTRFQVSAPTILKWKNRDLATDASSRPHNIAYALSDLEAALVLSVRQSSWLPLDEIYEMLLIINSTVSRSSIYRCLHRNKLNKVPQAAKEKAKTFKAYQPGYLHIDVTYLPKFDKQASYLFVAIDKATRTLFYKIYDNKTGTINRRFF